VSSSTVSRVCEQIKAQFDACCRRRLDEVKLDYLFLDGSQALGPSGLPSERTTSPVSTTCLNRRRSSRTCWSGAPPKSLATMCPSLPAGGR